MLGSFPPPKVRWSMEFFYPNWQNDMWRTLGYIYNNDRRYFELKGEKKFNKQLITEFCKDKGIALYDTACEVIRLKENASDKFLEVTSPTDIEALLNSLPHCTAIVTTGQKATETIAANFACPIPAIGDKSCLRLGEREYNLWRMPSTSRAYPLALEKKAAYYREMFIHEGLLP